MILSYSFKFIFLCDRRVIKKHLQTDKNVKCQHIEFIKNSLKFAFQWNYFKTEYLNANILISMSLGIDNASPKYNDYAVLDKDEKKPSGKLKLYVM